MDHNFVSELLEQDFGTKSNASHKLALSVFYPNLSETAVPYIFQPPFRLRGRGTDWTIGRGC